MLERPRAKLYFVHIRARKQKGEGRKEYEIGEGTYFRDKNERGAERKYLHYPERA